MNIISTKYFLLKNCFNCQKLKMRWALLYNVCINLKKIFFFFDTQTSFGTNQKLLAFELIIFRNLLSDMGSKYYFFVLKPDVSKTVLLPVFRIQSQKTRPHRTITRWRNYTNSDQWCVCEKFPGKRAFVVLPLAVFTAKISNFLLLRRYWKTFFKYINIIVKTVKFNWLIKNIQSYVIHTSHLRVVKWQDNSKWIFWVLTRVFWQRQNRK